MSRSDHPGVWVKIYAQLRQAGAGSFITWEDVEGMSGRPRDASRAAIVRARQELECKDGLTTTGQCKEGFWLVKQEDS